MNTKSSIGILAVSNLIAEFDPIEACYIGILGGISISKNGVSDSLSKKGVLKLIK